MYQISPELPEFYRIYYK